MDKVDKFAAVVVIACGLNCPLDFAQAAAPASPSQSADCATGQAKENKIQKLAEDLYKGPKDKAAQVLKEESRGLSRTDLNEVQNRFHLMAQEDRKTAEGLQHAIANKLSTPSIEDLHSPEIQDAYKKVSADIKEKVGPGKPDNAYDLSRKVYNDATTALNKKEDGIKVILTEARTQLLQGDTDRIKAHKPVACPGLE